MKVKLTAPYKFWFIHSVGITLKATATMRMEQNADVIEANRRVDMLTALSRHGGGSAVRSSSSSRSSFPSSSRSARS